MKFQQRSTEKELMDDLNLSGEDLKKNLDELAFINYWLGGNQVVINALNQLWKRNKIHRNKVFRVADLGSGGGDLLAIVAKWARKKKIAMELVGLDANDFMLNYAKDKTKDFAEITYLQCDVLSKDFDTKAYDLVLCSLFCHHFTDAELIELFGKLNQQTQLGFIINDLHRNWFAYHSIKVLTRLLGGSYLVQNDAPLSVLRAFKRNELMNLLEKASVSQYKIRWLWAFRFQVICVRNE